MRLYPAIDIRGGHAVRLLRGDYAHQTTYDANPLDAALRWVEAGAEALHVVDLDGARAGSPVNLEIVGRIVAESGISVQVGGGIRDEGAVEAVLATGAERAVLGTRAQGDPAFVGELVGGHGSERIIASVDGRRGNVAVEGWERATGTRVPELISELAGLGASRFVYTPVEVDGTLAGPGLEDIEGVAEACAAAGAELIYSGGVGSLQDLRSLVALELGAIGGVIVGRALYERRFSVAEAIATLREEAPR
jgi:phosphoribosylformimino-5-aminoimidazole carboxamide ribotide isomerase